MELYMDAFGYRLEDDGSIMFSWVIVNSYGQTLCLKGLLGEVQHQFMDLGANYTVDNFETQTVPMLQALGYVFDFNDKCKELLLRFPLANIKDLYDFRFQRVEPLINEALQHSGNGFCDYGYCDEHYLNMVPWVYSIEKAIQTLSIYLPQVLHSSELDYSIWSAHQGVPLEELMKEK